jgi:transcriptional regulator with XRE-family HTH domain
MDPQPQTESTPTNVTPWPRSNRMTPEEYEAERGRIRETYGENRRDAGVRFEQALARLFHVSGWTQEELAKKEKKSRAMISRWILFGRFLDFAIGNSISPNPALGKLSEGRFHGGAKHGYWNRTDKTGGNERQRFLAVLRLMEEEATFRKSPTLLRPQILEHFGDGKWHKLTTIAEKLGEDEQYVKHALDRMVSGETRSAKCERKLAGSTWSYRIFRIIKERSVSSVELATKLEPLIERLREVGKARLATVVIAEAPVVAHELRKLLDDWTG